MSINLPHVLVPAVPLDWDAANPAHWHEDAILLPPFTLADGSRLATQATMTRICYHTQALFVRFDCEDSDIWGTCTERDDALYDEEVVEVFLSAGAATPVNYYEFEVSPNSVLLDLTVCNPTGDRAEMTTDFAWNCPGLHWQAGRDDANHHWWATLTIPWVSVGATGDLPRVWRANFYRIERPRAAEPEFSGWSPTLTTPADFHKPAYFGILELE